MSSNDVWLVLTSLGNSGLMVPAAAMIAVQLLVVRAGHAARLWSIGFAAAVGLVLASKLAFLGWGIGIRPLDFTGISGHTALASAVLPVLGYLLLPRKLSAYSVFGAVFGLILALAVGVSRYMVGAHSPSEIVAGFVLGGTVAVAFIYSLQAGEKQVLHTGSLYILLILIGLSQTELAARIRAHDFVVKMALYASGREQPFTREEWQRAENWH